MCKLEHDRDGLLKGDDQGVDMFDFIIGPKLL